ncbi:MAG: twin-arginine translocation pathway signal protein [Pseudomonadota bacterium]
MKRRRYLKLIGGGVVLAAAGVGGFLSTRTPRDAIAPWQLAGQYTDPRKKALSYAILAPNPHNLQPWRVDLGVEDDIRLYVDGDLRLPETDPFDRQITVGLGCFIELLTMAAAEDDLRTEVTLFPEGSDAGRLDDRPVAHIRLTRESGVAPDPLFAHALLRRSAKEPFDPDRPVPASLVAELKRTPSLRGLNVLATVEPEPVQTLRDLTWRAFEIEYKTPAKLRESIDLMRLGKREINQTPDGIDLGGPFLESLMALGQLSREALGDPASMAYAEGLSRYREICDTAQGYVWVVSEGNDRTSQINAGRMWLRLNLASTGLGIGLHPLSQALQEYDEMKALYAEAHRLLTPDAMSDAGTVQMLGRIGYAPAIAPSPRWRLEKRMTPQQGVV